MIRFSKFIGILATAGTILSAVLMTGCGDTAEETIFLNVSYDPTCELYTNYNEKFKTHWEKDLLNGKVNLMQSHGGSCIQAKSVIEGVEADVVTLALAYDVINIKNAGLIRGGWQNEFPDNSSPYTSTIIFLVRKDNPKNIRDWDDLIRDDVKIVTPSLSILAEPTIAVVDKVVERKGTEKIATEYLNYLYSDEGQEIAAQNFYRPRNKKILAKYENIFKPLELFTIDNVFGGWVKAHNEHFADGATFDQVTEGIFPNQCGQYCS